MNRRTRLGYIVLLCLLLPLLLVLGITRCAYADNSAPVLDPIGDKTIDEGQLLQFSVSANDTDGDTLVFSANLTSLPPQAQFDPGTRTFSWTPTFDQAGSYPDVSFSVTDGTYPVSENITITVNNVNRPPTLDPVGDRSVPEGDLLEFTITGSDPDGDALSFSANLTSLPPEAQFEAATQTFSWDTLAGQAGEYADIRFEVTDGSLTSSENITISVLPPAIGTTIGPLTLVPTYETISVYSSFTGDANGDNQAVLEYRRAGEAEWRPGIPMTPDRREQVALCDYTDGSTYYEDNPFKEQWRAVIFWLQPDAEYEVRVTYTDPDGGSGSVTGTVRTLQDNPASPGQIYYVSPTGKDINNGLTTATPFKTIQKAADTVAPGDTVLIMPGTYNEEVVVNASGTPGNYITFQSYNANSPAVIDGEGALRSNFLLNGAHYVRIRGLTLANPFVGDGANIRIDGGTSDIIIQDNDMSFAGMWWGAAGVAIFDNYGATPASNLLIRENRITAGGDYAEKFGVFSWALSSYGIVIRDNVITGDTMKDGISGYWYKDVFVYGNRITGAWDDTLEIEGRNACVAIWDNVLESHAAMGLATAPVEIGPYYVFRNIIYGAYDASVKMGNSSEGYTYFYHNTLYARGEFTDGIAFFGNNPRVNNFIMRNNIIDVDRYTIENWETSPDWSLVDFDYDNLFTVIPEFAKWRDVVFSALDALNAAFAFEEHGISQASQFRNPAAGNFELQSTSPALDAGVLLPGFNDETSPWPYNGDAPDLGAIEYTPPVIQSGGGGGGGAPAGLFGLADKMNPAGALTTDVRVAAMGVQAYLNLPEGTICRTVDGGILSWIFMELVADTEIKPDSPPGSVPVAGYYELHPHGVTFEPAIRLTFKYDPAQFPEGFATDNLYIATWDEDSQTWRRLESHVDTEQGIIWTEISHFSLYTVMAGPRPADIIVSDLSLDPDHTYIDEETTASIVVANLGDETGSYHAALSLDDTVIQTREVTLEGGQTEAISFRVSVSITGEHTVSIGGMSLSLIVDESEPPPPPPPPPAPPPAKPASFIINGFSISSSQIAALQPVEVTAEVANVGGTAGTYKAVLKINGIEEDRVEVSLAPGESRWVVFVVSREEAGSYLAEVGGSWDYFDVTAPVVATVIEPETAAGPAPAAATVEPSTDWWLYGGIGGGVILLAGLLSYLLIRRHHPLGVFGLK